MVGRGSAHCAKCCALHSHGIGWEGSGGARIGYSLPCLLPNANPQNEQKEGTTMPAMQHSQSRPPREAGWTTVFIIAGAGVVSAFQVGKAPMALGAIQLDLGLSLVVVSWLISAFAIIGAIVGAPVGLAADRIGTKRMVVSGLALQALGAGLGGVSPGVELLMVSRVVEGLGFMAV